MPILIKRKAFLKQAMTSGAGKRTTALGGKAVLPMKTSTSIGKVTYTTVGMFTYSLHVQQPLKEFVVK